MYIIIVCSEVYYKTEGNTIYWTLLIENCKFSHWWQTKLAKERTHNRMQFAIVKNVIRLVKLMSFAFD